MNTRQNLLPAAVTSLVGSAAVGLSLIVFGCAAPPGGSGVAAQGCKSVAMVEMNPQAAGFLDALDPHSAGGMLWAGLKASCVGGAPGPNVSQEWIALVFGELRVLFPHLFG